MNTIRDMGRKDIGRRDMARLMAGTAGGAATGVIPPSVLDCLGELELAVDQIAGTWRPEDPAYRAELYRQIMMNLSFGYFVHFTADAEHPDWSPLYNPVFACQPNPDDIYLFSPIRDDLTYRVSGDRGTVSKLIFVSQHGIPGTLPEVSDYGAVNSLDDNDFTVGPDGRFEIIFSAKRPEGYSGNWSEIKPTANVIFTRARMIDWEKERDPRMSIECLDPVPPKLRLTPEQIIARIRDLARVPYYQSKVFFEMQNEITDAVGWNRIHPVRIPGLTKQLYWPAAIRFDDGEALILETEMPEVRPYWNIQINDPLFNAVEYVYRLSSINASTAWIAPDGKLRVVLAKEDPGVANWLDTVGYNEGTLYGRWYDCSSLPIPTITKVALAEVKDHLPRETPMVTPEERAEQLRRRIRAAQRRRRW